MRILSVFGTRPEAIKMAPLIKEMEKDPEIESVVCVTAQHREMLDQVLKLFEIEPDYDLNIMRQNQTLTLISEAVLKEFEGVLQEVQPDMVLVHGDTTTTFAAALSSFYEKRAVGHVEAGLRTYNKYSPFPEEMNRVLTDRIADLLFAPTERNRRNLLAEGVLEEKVFVTGNTVIDALLATVAKPFEFDDEVLKGLDFDKSRVVTVTCHRRENLGENMHSIFRAIRRAAEEFPDVEVVYPLHKNPKVRAIADEELSGADRVHLIEPLEYQEFSNLMNRSYLIVTDSGGIQEEAPSLGKPVLVVRAETERPEAVEAGTVRLAGVSEETIFQMLKLLLSEREQYDRMAHAENPYGDGHASERIVKILKEEIGR